MAVVRFERYLNSEMRYESLPKRREEWSHLSCSFKIKQIENQTIV